MKRVKIGRLVFIGLLLTSIPFSGQTLSSDKGDYDNDSLNKESIILLVNEKRTELGFSEVKESLLLTASAQKKAEDMARKGYFSHTSPEGLTAWHWFDDVRYDYRFAGENLGVNFRTSSGLMNAWIDSPTHRENILNDDYLEVGIGITEGIYKGKPTIFVVQHFGALQEQPHHVQVKGNKSEVRSEIIAILEKLETLRLALVS